MTPTTPAASDLVWDELLGRLRAQLLATLERRGVDPELAEDLVQESLARIWRRLASLRDPSRLRPWATSIVLNRWKTHMGRRREHEAVPETLSWRGPEPEETVTLQEGVSWVRNCIAELPPEQRLSIRLRVLEGLTIASGRVRLGVSRNCFRSRFQKGMQRLRERAATRAGRHAAAALGLS